MKLPLQFRHYLAIVLLVLLGLAVRVSAGSGAEQTNAASAPTAAPVQLASRR